MYIWVLPAAAYIVSGDGLEGLGGGSLICKSGVGDCTIITCKINKLLYIM